MATIVSPMLTSANAMQYAVHQYYNKVYIERLITQMYWYQACEKRDFPKKAGKTIVFHGYKSIGIGTNLTEATNPTPKVMSVYNVSAALAEYGDYTGVSNIVEMTAISSVIEEAVNVFAEASADTMDKYLRKIAFGGGMHITPVGKSLSAGVRTRYTGSVSSFSALNNKVLGFTLRLVGSLSAAGDAISASANFTASAWEKKLTLLDVRRAVTVLRHRRVKPMDGTYYMGIMSSHVSEHLRSDTSTGGWIDWLKYTNPNPMYKGEIGQAEGVRFVETENAFDYPLGNASLSATIITIVGKGGLVVTDFKSIQDVRNGMNKDSIIIKRSSQYDTNNPLNLLAATVGYEWIIAAAVLNPSCGIHLAGICKA